MVSNQQLFEKLVMLDSTQKQIVEEFINFLLSKRQIKQETENEFLLRTSVWSDEELQPIEDAHKAINTWQPTTW